jgi:hypothetical protein
VTSRLWALLHYPLKKKGGSPRMWGGSLFSFGVNRGLPLLLDNASLKQRKDWFGARYT